MWPHLWPIEKILKLQLSSRTRRDGEKNEKNWSEFLFSSRIKINFFPQLLYFISLSSIINKISNQPYNKKLFSRFLLTWEFGININKKEGTKRVVLVNQPPYKLCFSWNGNIENKVNLITHNLWICHLKKNPQNCEKLSTKCETKPPHDWPTYVTTSLKTLLKSKTN